MEKTVTKFLWEDKIGISNILFLTNGLKDDINSYTKQDEKAHRTCDLTVQQFRTLLKSGVCYNCSHPVIRSNCSVDRKNNYI